LGWKPRTNWDNAVNSVSSVERFLESHGLRGAKGVSGARSAANSRWPIGSKIRHAKFGVGTILGTEGEGDEIKLTVSFPGYGRKKLMAQYAALEKA
jgi:DNA helicase-2/ATP-dependent DNA helicase PcrA